MPTHRLVRTTRRARGVVSGAFTIRRPTPALATPAAPDGAEPSPAPASAPVPSRCPRVLVVDDDPDVRDALAALVTAAGYAVVAVADGADALDYLRAGPPPDVIITDLTMPRVDGWALCAAVRAEPARATIPLIVVSSVADAPGRVPPGDVALRKPLAVERLLAELARRVRA